MLVTIDQVLNAEEIATIRSLLAQAEWATGQSAGTQARLAKNNLQIPEGGELLKNLRVLGYACIEQKQPIDFGCPALQNFTTQLQPLHR